METPVATVPVGRARLDTCAGVGATTATWIVSPVGSVYAVMLVCTVVPTTGVGKMGVDPLTITAVHEAEPGAGAEVPEGHGKHTLAPLKE